MPCLEFGATSAAVVTRQEQCMGDRAAYLVERALNLGDAGSGRTLDLGGAARRGGSERVPVGKQEKRDCSRRERKGRGIKRARKNSEEP